MTLRRAFLYLYGYFRYNIRLISTSPPKLLALAASFLGTSLGIHQLSQSIGQTPTAMICLSVIALYIFLLIQQSVKSEQKALPSDLRYRVIVPATTNQHKRITEACAYFGNSAIDPIDGTNAIEADQYSTAALRDFNGREVGFADYYAFRKSDAKRYINGNISKRDFFSDYYLPHPKARDADALYISTIFRYDHISDRSAFGAKEAAILCWCIIKLITIVQKEPIEGWLIFTAGGTPAGERLIKHFDLDDTGKLDPDGNKLFQRDNVTLADLMDCVKKLDYLGKLIDFNVHPMGG